MGKQQMCIRCKSQNIKRSPISTGIGVLNLPQCQECLSTRVTGDILEIRREKLKK